MESRFTRFKFATNTRPPPPPPKDDIYQRPTPSLQSLAIALDPPASPNSPTSQYAYALRRANSPSPSPFSAAENNQVGSMNYSTPSLLSPPAHPTDNTTGNRQTTLSTASKKDKALAFLKFPKRSPRTPPAVGTSSSAPAASVLIIGNPVNGTDEELPPPPQEDDGISMPWNFQHNIHVDEGYVGLPPSWSTSLASAGFTVDEIADIQARRAAGVRSPPDLKYLYNERPQSPAVSAFPPGQQAAFSTPGVSVLTHPLPRTTSLHRLPPSSSSNLNSNPSSANSNSPSIEPASSSRPNLPSINTSSTNTSNSSSTSSSANTSNGATANSNTSTPLSTRKPPPRRKPPTPLEADLQEEAKRTGYGQGHAHKPNQASQSTVAQSEEYSGSSSNHSTTDNTTTSFSGLNNSVAYKYNPGDTSYASVSNPQYTQRQYMSDTDYTDDDTPLARAPLRLGSESNFSVGSTVNGTGRATGGPGGTSGFKVMNGETTERERPKVPWTVEGGSTEGGLDADGLEIELEMEMGERPPREVLPSGVGVKEKKSSIWGTKISKTKSKEGSTSTHGSEAVTQYATVMASSSASVSGQPTPSSSTWKASTSTSIANAMSKGSTLVDAVRGGVAKMAMRSVSGSSKEGMGNGLKNSKAKKGIAPSFKSRRNGTSAEGGDEDDAEDSDEEFSSLPPEGEEFSTPVWEIYRRPPGDATASTDSLSKSALKRSASVRSRESQRATKNSQAVPQPLRRQPSNRSQLTSQSTPSLKESRSGSSLRSGAKSHKKSGSMTSLESIPEASPPPLPSGAAEKVSLANGSRTELVSKKTPALPPRLSLHQYSDSSDLSSWSEALLSGISLSAAGKDIGFGLDLDFSNFNKEKEPASAPATATQAGGLTAKPLRTFQSQAPTQSQPQPQAQTQVPSQSSTQNAPQPADRSTPTPPPAQRPLTMRKAGQPLPNSKPPPQRPIPPIILGNLNSGPPPLPMPPNVQNNSIAATKGVGASTFGPLSISRSNSRTRPADGASSLSHAQSGWMDSSPVSPAPPSAVAEPSITARLMSTTPSVFTLPPTTPLTPNPNKPLPPVTPSVESTPSAALQQSTAPPPESHLSPPPSAWSIAADAVHSPGGSSVGPDSAQLWNEIEQMMDPTMMGNVPGLHLSGLPLGAQGVLKSAGITMGANHGHPPPNPLSIPPVGLAAMASSSTMPKTVGDLVGTSPTYSAALTESFSATLPFTPEEERMEAQRRLRGNVGVLGTKEVQDVKRDQVVEQTQDEDSDGSDYGDEDGLETLKERQDRLRRDRSPSRDQDNSGQHLTVEDYHLSERDTNRDSSRSSTSTLTVTALAATTIVRNVSIARRAGAYVIDRSDRSAPSPRVNTFGQDVKHPPSPLSSHFGGTGSEESSGDSVSSSSQEQELQPTPTTTDGGLASPLLYYLEGSVTPSPTPDKMVFDQQQRLSAIQSHSQSHSKEDDYDEPFEGYPDEETMEAEAAAAAANATTNRPTIVINDVSPREETMPSLTTSTSTPGTSTPLSPYQRYRGWLSDVVAPLEEFIDEAVDPRDHYSDLNEIAEGESGSVFAAVLNPTTATKLRLPPLIKAKDANEIMANRTVLVAIKSVAIVPSGSPKLSDLQKELTLMRGLGHDNILGMDGVYVDLQEDSLWVRMELMERSLADIIGLVGDGLQLQERTIARFTSDILCALEYLQRHNIAHRDVRSDNLLLNKHGVLKLADFSNAIQVTPEDPMRSDIVGVPFWQAPEVRKSPYNALKVDVWSLGATVWEMAEQDPPFADTQQLADRWPPLHQPELFSPAFHEFLRKCSEPAASRPDPSDLLKSSLIVHKACGRQVIVLLLNQCMAIEKAIQEGNAES